jgi:ATP-dependent DNA helicase RecQ
MALKYPISQAEVDKYSQHRRRESKKYGAEFVALITMWMKSEIVRPDDLVVKSTGTNSSALYHTNIDRKLSLDDIAKQKGLTGCANN